MVPHTYEVSGESRQRAVQGDDDRNSPLDTLMTLGTASNSPKLFTDLTIFPNEYVCTLIVFVLFKIKSNLSMGFKSAPSFTNMVPGNSLQWRHQSVCTGAERDVLGSFHSAYIGCSSCIPFSGARKQEITQADPSTVGSPDENYCSNLHPSDNLAGETGPCTDEQEGQRRKRLFE